MKSSRIASIVFAAIMAILMLGCSGSKTDQVLDRADSLMDVCPDSIYQVLDSVCRNNAPKPTRMRAELLKAKAQNKAYVDFTTDSVMLEVADYYDRHGSANNRMLAHYLLGCTYRDLKEAPMSLQCYYDAVEAADTTSSDCDYRTMMSIYGQIATILDKQYMPMEELDALKQYQKYALLSGDTLNYIRGMELRIKAFNLMCNTEDSILEITEETHRQYSKYGYDKEAASVYLSAISVYLDRQDYAKAHELMCIFENESGLFDEKGNIKIGREYYYTLKGRYYYGMQNLDSAQSYFRKRLAFNKNSADTYAYMLHLYAQNGNTDSLLEYTEKLCVAFNQLQTDMHTEAMHQAKGMYDYTRNQKIAHQKELEAQQNKLVLYAFIVAAIIVALLALSKYRKYKNKKSRELASLNSKYSQAIQEIESANEELRLLETDSAKLQARKRAEISRLKEKLHDYEAEIARMSNTSSKEAFLNSDIVMLLKDDKRMVKAGCEVTDSEWDELQSVLRQCLPSFYSKINQGDLLTHQEKQICILTLMNVGTKEMSNMLHSTPSRISNAKATVNQKLFNDQSGAQSLRRNILAFVSKM